MDKSDLTRSEVIQTIANRGTNKLPLCGVKFNDLNFSFLLLDEINFRYASFKNCKFLNEFTNTCLSDVFFDNCDINFGLSDIELSSTYITNCDIGRFEIQNQNLEITEQTKPNCLYFRSSELKSGLTLRYIQFSKLHLFDCDLKMIGLIYANNIKNLEIENSKIDIRITESIIENIKIKSSKLDSLTFSFCTITKGFDISETDTKFLRFENCKMPSELYSDLKSRNITVTDHQLIV